MLKKFRSLIFVLILLLSSLLIIAANYYSNEYPIQSFDQIIYYMVTGIEGTSSSVIVDIIKSNFIPVVIVFIFLYILSLHKVKNKLVLKVAFKERKINIQLYPIKIIANHKILYSLILIVFSCSYFIKGFKIDDYIVNIIQTSTIYEEYYVEADSSYMTFPEQKRNLIFISMESMENTFCSKENGGDWDVSIIPELEELALEYISFSNTDKLGGPFQYTGTTFTTGGLVAQTAGVPLKTTTLSMGDNYQSYIGKGEFLSNAYALGDVLKENGYNLEVIMGSDGNFGGRTQYYEANGDYKIFDYYYAIENGFMTPEESVWWGFEDATLYEWSKSEILNLANQDEPFNFIIQTSNTHFPDGYVSSTTEEKYPTQYENVYADSSKLLYEFVSWVQKQDFYENTTIVIIGDHLNMQSDFAEKAEKDNYIRTIYNVIINSAIETSYTKNRQFSSMDFYPTILASIGITIEGDRIAMGTNLFSNRMTLSEELGHDYYEAELKKNSKFYNSFLLGFN